MTHAASPPPPSSQGFAAHERTCPTCGTTATTPFEQCPLCGRRYDAPPPDAGRGRRRALAAAGAVLLAATAVFVALSLHAKARQERRDRAADAVAVAHERARLIRLQAPHRGAATDLRPPGGASRAQLLQARHALVLAVQDAITQDARRRAGTREIDGPIVGTQCGPLLRAPDAVPDDRRLERTVGRFDCLALRRSVVGADGRQVAGFGYPFVAAVDFRRFTYTFCRNTPPQSERGQALAQVRLDRACLAARGRALGTGYADTDGERG